MRNENIESVKYITKKINTDVIEVFLATINQIRANTNSRRNLRPIETRLYIVWLSGSLTWPLRKIKIVVRAMTEKKNVRIGVLPGTITVPATEFISRPAPAMIKFSISSIIMYRLTVFKRRGHFRKSLTAV
jgi:hypothetical protein